MKIRIAFLLSLLLAPSSNLQAQTSNAVPIAVLNVAGPRRTLANNISALLTVNLSAEPGFVLVDRNQLNKVMEEQALGRSGNISPETAAKIGQLTGAKILVTGREFSANRGDEIVIIGNVVGAETGRVFSHTVQGSTTDMVGLVSKLSQAIIQTIHEQSTNLISAVGNPQAERINTIMAGIKGRKLPTVAIQIEERIAGERGSSHTTATELSRILQKAGFTVVDEKSRKKADVLITGDALTDKPARNGDLFSCRATLQIKAQERVAGKIISLDMQQSSAVDSGEQTVAAKALQTAVDEIAKRLLPLLVGVETKTGN